MQRLKKVSRWNPDEPHWFDTDAKEEAEAGLEETGRMWAARSQGRISTITAHREKV